MKEEIGRFWVTVTMVAVALLAGATGRAEERLGPCYRFIFELGDFSSGEVESFALDAEGLCRTLQDTLGTDRKERIPVYLKPGEGISSTLSHQNRAIDLYFARPIGGVESPLVHETTHILVDSPHPVLREGLAVAMEERVGSLRTHPTYGFSLDDWMGAIRCAGRFVPLGELEKQDWRGGPWETNIIAYVESGSFVRYLVERYGLDAVVQAVQWTDRTIKVPVRRDQTPNIPLDPLDRICEERFGSPFASLEAAWISDSGTRRGESDELCEALKAGTVQSFLRKKLK